MGTINIDLSKQGVIPYYLFKIIKVVKTTKLLRFIHGFSAMPIKITARYFMEIYKMMVTSFLK